MDSRLVLAAALLGAAGCVADVGTTDGDVAPAQANLRRCFPAHNHYNCAPLNDCPDFRRVCRPRREWPIRSGTELYDGLGGVMGVVTDPAVRINHGIRKELDGRVLVYAWAVHTDGGMRSGWIEERAVIDWRTLREAMGSSRHRDPGEGDYETLRTITGGDAARHGALKIQPNESRGGRNATDYLLRPGNVVNMLYSVPGQGIGGHSVDSFPVGVTFHRARGVRQIVVPLYPAGSARSTDALHFVYGWVHDGRQPRYGWVAEEAMTQVPAAPADPGVEGGDNCWVRCQDSSLYHSYQPSSSACRGWYEVCADHGRVARMRFEGALVYDADAP